MLLSDIDGESGVKENTHAYFDIHTPAGNVLGASCVAVSLSR